MTLIDTLRAAKAPERSIPLCLRGDINAEYEVLERRLVAALKKRDDEFGGSSDVPTLIERMERLRLEMQAATATFHLRSIGLGRVADLMASHPPREDSKRDQRDGFNHATFYPALIRATCYRVTTPEEALELHDDQGHPNGAMTVEAWGHAADGDQQADGLLGALSSRQFQRLRDLAWAVDQEDIEVPFSPSAFISFPPEGATSEQLEGGTQLPANGKVGKSARSRSTSTTKKADSSGR